MNADPAASSSDSDSEESSASDQMPTKKHKEESDSEDSDDSSSDEDEEDTRRSKATRKPDGSSSEEEDSDDSNDHKQRRAGKHKNDDKWSDEEDSDAASSDEEGDNNNNEEANQSLSLMERLKNQEDKQASLTTTTALKIRRERRNRAIPIAKERLQAFKKKQQTKGDDDDDDNDSATNDSRKKRKSKHAPTEVSSRRRRSHQRSLNESGIGVQIGSNRYQPRDPRMSNLSGHLDADQFERQFGFLEDLQTKEIGTLKRKLKSLQKTGKKGQRERRKLGVTVDDTAGSLQERLQVMQTTVARQNQDRLERNAKRAVKQKIHAQVAEGKGGVYFPKRQEMRRMQMEAKVEEIKKQSGKHGLDRYLAKRRKKQKSVHAKKMRSAGAGFVGERSSFGGSAEE